MANPALFVAGSPDQGTTKAIIKTDATGKLLTVGENADVVAALTALKNTVATESSLQSLVSVSEPVTSVLNTTHFAEQQAAIDSTAIDITPYENIFVEVSGTLAGANVTLKGSLDGDSFWSLMMTPCTSSEVSKTSMDTQGIFSTNIAGLSHVQACLTGSTAETLVTVKSMATTLARAGASQVNVSDRASRKLGEVTLSGSLPAFGTSLTYDFPDIGSLLLVNTAAMYRANATVLEKSTDMGESWTAVNDFTPLKPVFVWTPPITTSPDVVLVWVAAAAGGVGDLYRSLNGGAFAKVQESVYAPYRPDGVGFMPFSIIMYGEYTPSDTDHRIFKSADQGATWTAVKTHTGAQSRHWHNAHYLSALGGWLATSGEADGQLHWVFSPDTGTTWYYILSRNVGGLYPNNIYRTTHVEVDPYGDLIWASDQPAPDSGIYKASLGSLFTPELLLPANDAIEGLYRTGNMMIAATTNSSGTKTKHCDVYVSLNGGATWHRDKRFPGVGGAPHIYYPFGTDALGRVYYAADHLTAAAIQILRCTPVTEGVQS